jgi:hypothetical protein
MLTRILKWSAIAVLMGDLFWRPFAAYSTVLQFVVSATAIVVVVQAWGMRQYVWMILFLVAAGLFNPVLPVGFSNHTLTLVSVLMVFLLFFSLHLLQPKPMLSIASTTDRMPGSESL